MLYIRIYQRVHLGNNCPCQGLSFGSQTESAMNKNRLTCHGLIAVKLGYKTDNLFRFNKTVDRHLA